MSSVEPISRGALYHCYYDFQVALNEWEQKHGHQLRVGSSESLKNSEGLRDETFRYRVLVLQCVHYGTPRNRSSGKRRLGQHLASGCCAMLRLNFSQKEQLLRITSLIDVHSGHELEPGKSSIRKRISDQLAPLKKARMSMEASGQLNSSFGTPVTPRSAVNLDFGVKPRIAYPMIAALAVYNSPAGSLLTKDIYRFFETYFPFFRTAYGSWKNSVRHALHTHHYFEKELGPNNDKENLMFKIKDMDKFLSDVENFEKKYPEKSINVYGLSYPQDWENMSAGRLKDSSLALARPIPKRPKGGKKEVIDPDYTPAMRNTRLSAPTHLFPTPSPTDEKPYWAYHPELTPGSSPKDRLVPNDDVSKIWKPVPMRPSEAEMPYASDGLMLLAETASQAGNQYNDLRYL